MFTEDETRGNQSQEDVLTEEASLFEQDDKMLGYITKEIRRNNSQIWAWYVSNTVYIISLQDGNYKYLQPNVKLEVH